MSKKASRGFTLIELLVVISIISLLSSIVYAFLSGARESARIAAGMQFDASVLHGIGDQLIGEWKFDDNSNPTLDTSGFNNNGTVNNAIWNSSGGYNNRGFYNFDQTNNSITIPINSISNELTITTWVKNTTGTPGGIITKGLSGFVWAFYLSFGSGTLSFGPYYGFQHYLNYPWTGSLLKGWHFIAVTANIATATKQGHTQLYIDGVKVLENSFSEADNYPFNLSGGYPTIMGSFDNPTSSYSLDNVRIYSASLTAMDVQKLYAEEFPSHQQDLAVK